MLMQTADAALVDVRASSETTSERLCAACTATSALLTVTAKCPGEWPQACRFGLARSACALGVMCEQPSGCTAKGSDVVVRCSTGLPTKARARGKTAWYMALCALMIIFLSAVFCPAESMSVRNFYLRYTF